MWPSSSSSSSSPFLFQNFYSRRLMLHNLDHHSSSKGGASPPSTTNGASELYMGDHSFDANVVMVLSVLLCALICALGLNSIIRCALRYSHRAALESGDTTAATRLANTGVKRKALKTFPIITYLAGTKLHGLDTECIICLSEFDVGENLRILPKCNHGFHVRCIDKWLMAHSSCPTCRHCLIDTCQKIVNGNQPSASHAPPLQPLEPEDLIRIYRSIC